MLWASVCIVPLLLACSANISEAPGVYNVVYPAVSLGIYCLDRLYSTERKDSEIYDCVTLRFSLQFYKCLVYIFGYSDILCMY